MKIVHLKKRKNSFYGVLLASFSFSSFLLLRGNYVLHRNSQWHGLRGLPFSKHQCMMLLTTPNVQ